MRPRFAESKALSRLILTVAVVTAGLAMQGCVYRMTIQQGNFLEDRSVSQLQVGMTRSQVRYLLGTPMVPDAFDKDRWDYLYYLKIGRLRKPLERHLVVYFQDDKVNKVDNQGSVEMPDAEKREIEPGTATPPSKPPPPTSPET